MVILMLTTKCLVSRLHAVFLSSSFLSFFLSFFYIFMLIDELFCGNLRMVSLKAKERTVLIMLRIGYTSTYLARRIPWVQGGYILFFIKKSQLDKLISQIYFVMKLHGSDSSSVHHQEFIHCTLSNGIRHRGL